MTCRGCHKPACSYPLLPATVAYDNRNVWVYLCFDCWQWRDA